MIVHWLLTPKRTYNALLTVSLLFLYCCLSIKKTEVLCQAAPGTTQPKLSIKIDRAVLKNVEDFAYLGSCLSSSGGLDNEISCRLSKASSAFGRL